MVSVERCVAFARSRSKECVWRTAVVECRTLTFDRTARILNGNMEGVPADTALTVMDVRNAWAFLARNAGDPLTATHVREYNRILGDGLVPHAGAYRRHMVRITGTGWVPPQPTAQGVRGRLHMSLGVADPVESAVRVLLDIQSGQWFDDGNKRTALMAANHVLVSRGVGLLLIPPRSVERFVSLLLDYDSFGDLEPLVAWAKRNMLMRVPGTR